MGDYFPWLNSSIPALTLLCAAVLGAATNAFLAGFFLSLARRRISWAPMLAIVGGTLLLINATSLVHNTYLLFLAFATGFAFSWVLVSFNLLTLSATVFTSQLSRNGYMLTKMFQSFGDWQFWFLFVAWAVVFAWGIFAGFRPIWDRIGGRMAEMF